MPSLCAYAVCLKEDDKGVCDAQGVCDAEGGCDARLKHKQDDA